MWPQISKYLDLVSKMFPYAYHIIIVEREVNVNVEIVTFILLLKYLI